jgi:hypothetical protein
MLQSVAGGVASVVPALEGGYHDRVVQFGQVDAVWAIHMRRGHGFSVELVVPQRAAWPDP